MQDIYQFGVGHSYANAFTYSRRCLIKDEELRSSEYCTSKRNNLSLSNGQVGAPAGDSTVGSDSPFVILALQGEKPRRTKSLIELRVVVRGEDVEV